MKFLTDILAKAGLIVDGATRLNTIANASTDTDRFIVSDAGVVKYRTGAQLASDIDAMTKAVYDTDSDGVVDSSEKVTIIARNSTGSTIYKGTIVYLSGSTGNRPNILKSQANSEATSSRTFGVVVDDISNNADGEVAALGTLHDLDTRTSASHPFTSDTLLDGDTLWLSPTTAGYVTRTKPTAPNHAVFIGIVARTSPTNGRIVYRIQNGYELEELHNVSALTPSNNDGIFYNSATGLWEAKSIAAAAGGTIGTVTSVAMTVPTGLQIGGSPITNSGILALTYATGYSIPTNVKQGNWDDAYTWVSNFPTQTGNSGKFLKTDGSSLSWAVVDALPSQTGNSGKYLTTDGTTASWSIINLSGYVLNTRTLTINGTSYDLTADRSWSVGTITSLTAGTGITGGTITGSGTVAFDTTWGDARYQQVLVNPVTGSGTTNYLPKWTSSSSLGNSLVFDNGTNVGIGTTSPYVTAGTGLDVYGVSYSTIRVRAGAYAAGLELTFGGTAEGYLYQRANGFLQFGTNNTDRMRITASGRVLINTTTESTYELDVVGDIRSTLDANINGLTVGKGGGSVASNTVVGSNAGASITTAGLNTLIGLDAGRNITDQGANTFVGWYSGRALNTGYYNTAVGVWSLAGATSGHSNVAIGMQAGEAVTTGLQNVFVGMYAGNITTGRQNTIIGYNTGGGITTGNYNTIIGSSVTGLSASLSNTIILADGQGNQRLYINNNGTSYIKGGGSSLNIHNSSGGGYNLVLSSDYSYDPFVQMSYGGGLNPLSPGRTNFLEVGAIFMSLKAPNTMSLYTAANERLRIFSNGNIGIGTTTDAGYKLDVNGTARVSDVFHANNSTITFGAVRVKETSSGYGLVVHPNASTTTYTQYNSSGLVFWNGTVAATFSQIGGSLYSDVNTANAMYHRFSNTHVFTITSGGAVAGAVSLTASAVLEATSTTKGFLPPRMTGAQAEAIATPASGLMVYSTDGSGTTITSLGWWGYNGTTWVKLN